MSDEHEPRCGGSGTFGTRVVTPRLDRRDPGFEVEEFACLGCPDCAPRDDDAAAPTEEDR